MQGVADKVYGGRGRGEFLDDERGVADHTTVSVEKEENRSPLPEATA